jgi:hypothetical protein
VVLDGKAFEDMPDAEEAGQEPCPKASHWIWRPWYAKLWWVLSLVYWAGKLASFVIAVLDQFYATALAGILNVVFFPFTILVMLGGGYVRAWMGPIQWDGSQDHVSARGRSMGGQRDPASDPVDPRSGANWVGHPSNIARLFGQKWP